MPGTSMLQTQRQVYAQLQKLIDAGVFTLALWVAHTLRMRWRLEVFGGTAEIKPFTEYLWLMLVIFPLAPLLLDFQGFYNRRPSTPLLTTAWQLFWATVSVTILIVLVSFATKEQPARSVILLFGAVSFLLTLLKEVAVRHSRVRGLGGAQARRRILLLGVPEDLRRVREELLNHVVGRVEILGEFDIHGVSTEQLLEAIHRLTPNAVLISAQHAFFGQIERAIQACELEGVEVWLMAGLFKTQVSRTTLDDSFGQPMMVFRSAPEASWQGVAKQLLDFFGAMAILAVAAIPMMVVAALIRLTSPGPVLFRQARSGLNGKPFTMLKFRSMSTDAEQRKQELAALNEMSGPVFKVTNDPRITPIGRLLRKFSIDEFPQLLNVIKGEMSLVGPRPLPVDEVMKFDDLAHRRRLSVKPGLTCLWQISGRNNVKDFRDWVRLDLEYIDNWSIWLDLKILVQTIPVVLFGTGAK